MNARDYPSLRLLRATTMTLMEHGSNISECGIMQTTKSRMHATIPSPTDSQIIAHSGLLLHFIGLPCSKVNLHVHAVSRVGIILALSPLQFNY